MKMEKRAIQEKILRKLMAMNPPKWGGSHTEETNLVKGLPSHLRGEKIVEKFENLGFKIGNFFRKVYILRTFKMIYYILKKSHQNLYYSNIQLMKGA
jgi:hypothetical protein